MAQFTIPARDTTTEMRFQMGYALADLAAEHPRIVAVDADLRTSSGSTSSSTSIPTSSSRSASPSRI